MIGPAPFIEGYFVPPFKWESLEGKFLVTNEMGAWAVLDREQLNLLRARRVQDDPGLFASLKANNIIFPRSELRNLGDRVSKKFWYLANGTSLHVIATTNKCNFACKYCYAPSRNKESMSVETAEKVADFILQSPAKRVVLEFSGGEPTLNFDVIETIVNRANKLAPKKGKEVGVAIINNGSKWNKKKMEYAMVNKIGVCFSLDGPKDLHNKHRRYLSGEGTYDDVVRTIKKFKKADYPGIQAIPVITKYSLPRWKDIVDEYLSLDLKKIRFKYLSYFGRAPSLWKELGYTADEFVDSWKNCLEYIYQLNRKGVFVIEGLTQIIARKMFQETDPGFAELQMPCGAAISQMAYSPDGSVYTCDEGRMFEEFKIGSVDQPYSKVIKNSLVKGMAAASCGFLNKCDSCALKPFCGVCPVEAFNETGNIDVKIPKNRRCKIHKSMLTHLFSKASGDRDFSNMLRNWIRERRGNYLVKLDCF